MTRTREPKPGALKSACPKDTLVTNQAGPGTPPSVHLRDCSVTRPSYTLKPREYGIQATNVDRFHVNQGTSAVCCQFSFSHFFTGKGSGPFNLTNKNYSELDRLDGTTHISQCCPKTFRVGLINLELSSENLQKGLALRRKP